jgi:hypothetical protein
MTQEQADYVEDVSTGTDINLLSIQVIADLKIGYAAIQNNIPVIREILVTNNGETTLCAAELVVKSVPTFAESARFHFDRLAAWRVGVSPLTSVRTTNISISSMNLSEPLLPHRYAFRETVLATATHNIDILAYDQWAGTRSLPELAAFCMPNSRVVDKLLVRASAAADFGRPVYGWVPVQESRKSGNKYRLSTAMLRRTSNTRTRHRSETMARKSAHLNVCPGWQARDVSGPRNVVRILPRAGRFASSCYVQGPRLGWRLADRN